MQIGTLLFSRPTTPPTLEALRAAMTVAEGAARSVGFHGDDFDAVLQPFEDAIACYHGCPYCGGIDREPSTHISSGRCREA